MEAQGRAARCKRCGEKFLVPKSDNLEDSILTWLSAGDEHEEDVLSQPRVISMPDKPVSADDSSAGGRVSGSRVIRQKTATERPKA